MNKKNFASKAIEGGWIYQDEKPIYNDNQKAPCIASFSFDGINFGITLEQIILDPKAWEAVGRVEGWGLLCNKCKKCILSEDGGCEDNNCGGDDFPFIEEWKEKQNGLMPHLQEGGTIESYIETL